MFHNLTVVVQKASLFKETPRQGSCKTAFSHKVKEMNIWFVHFWGLLQCLQTSTNLSPQPVDTVRVQQNFWSKQAQHSCQAGLAWYIEWELCWKINRRMASSMSSTDASFKIRWNKACHSNILCCTMKVNPFFCKVWQCSIPPSQIIHHVITCGKFVYNVYTIHIYGIILLQLLLLACTLALAQGGAPRPRNELTCQ